MYGLVINATNGILREIDAKEGHPRCYRRLPLLIKRDDGRPAWAWTYIAEANRGGRRDIWPTGEYKELLTEVARAPEYGFPQEYVEKLERVPTIGA